MKILFYCCEFAPEQKTGAIRPSKLVKYLERKNIDITVYTKVVDKGIHNRLINDLSKTTRKKIIRFNLKKYFQINDDGFWFFLSSFFPLLKFVKINKPDYIFISVPVFLPLISVYLVHKLTGVKYIIDYRDLWYRDPYKPKSFKDKILRKLGKYTERKLMANAFLVNFISKAMKADQENYFGKVKNSCVISTGFDSEDLNNIYFPSKILESNTRYISHIGMLDWDMNIDVLIECIKNVVMPINTKFLFVGGKNNLLLEAFKKNNILHKCEFVNTVDKITALSITKYSVGILILGSDSAQRLNRKVFESVAVNSNIFYYGNTESPTAKVLKDSMIRFVFDKKVDTRILYTEFNEFCNINNRCSSIPKEVMKYDKVNIAHSFLERIY